MMLQEFCPTHAKSSAATIRARDIVDVGFGQIDFECAPNDVALQFETGLRLRAIKRFIVAFRRLVQALHFDVLNARDLLLFQQGH